MLPRGTPAPASYAGSFPSGFDLVTGSGWETHRVPLPRSRAAADRTCPHRASRSPAWSASRSGPSRGWSPAHRPAHSRRRWRWALPLTTLSSCRLATCRARSSITTSGTGHTPTPDTPRCSNRDVGWPRSPGHTGTSGHAWCRAYQTVAPPSSSAMAARSSQVWWPAYLRPTTDHGARRSATATAHDSPSTAAGSSASNSIGRRHCPVNRSDRAAHRPVVPANWLRPAADERPRR